MQKSPSRGNGRDLVMRRVILAATAAAVIGIASPASAVTLEPYNGPDLATMIKASTTSSATNTVPQVWGCTQNDGACANISFTGLQLNQIATENINITGGAGFASITDSTLNAANNNNFYNL